MRLIGRHVIYFRDKWVDLAEKVDMGLTWIDHDTIEHPVEEVEVM